MRAFLLLVCSLKKQKQKKTKKKRLGEESLFVECAN